MFFYLLEHGNARSTLWETCGTSVATLDVSSKLMQLLVAKQSSFQCISFFNNCFYWVGEIA